MEIMPRRRSEEWVLKRYLLIDALEAAEKLNPQRSRLIRAPLPVGYRFEPEGKVVARYYAVKPQELILLLESYVEETVQAFSEGRIYGQDTG